MRATDRDKIVIRKDAMEQAGYFFEAGEPLDKGAFLDIWAMLERGLIEGPAAIRDVYVNPPAGATVLTVVK